MSILDSMKNGIKKILLLLIVIPAPYFGLIILYIYKPFSKKTRSYLYAYCSIVCVLLAVIFIVGNKSENSSTIDSPEQVELNQNSDIGFTEIEENKVAIIDDKVLDNESEQNSQNIQTEDANEVEESEEMKSEGSNKSDTAPFYRYLIEDKIYPLFNEGLDFSFLDYMQWDPMEIELYHCKNTFEGKLTKKKHHYLARIGYDREKDESTLYFLSIDGETVYWDEEGEDLFFELKGI